MKNLYLRLLFSAFTLCFFALLIPNRANATCTANITGLKFYDLVGSNDVTISNNGTYSLSALPSSFTLESIYSGSMGSMKFTVTGSASATIIENYDPYNYPAGGSAWTHGTGTFTVKMEAYHGSNASGNKCDTKTITFTLTSGGNCTELTSAGSIAADEVLCGTSDPSLITSVSPASGGSGGTIEYIWLKNSTASNSGSTVIPGATGLTYDPGPITQTTYYRRCARRCGGNYIKETNWVKKEVEFCTPTPNCSSTNTFTWSQSINPNTGSASAQRFICGQTTSIDITSLPGVFNGPVTVNVTDAVSYDGYSGRSNTGNQPNEKWRVVFKKGNSTVYATPYTNDLATGVEQDSWQGSLGTATLLPNGADKIVLEHYCVANGNSTGANSVVPTSICITYSTPPPSNCCIELPMVTWDMDACLSCSGNNNVFTEFSGTTSACFPGTAYNLSASANHSCVAGVNGTNRAVCIKDGNYFQLKADINPPANEDFSVTRLKYYVVNPLSSLQMPPCGGQVSGGNIPTYMLEVYLGGSVVHSEVRNLPNSWTQEVIDLSGISALQNITNNTQLKIRLTTTAVSGSAYFDLDEFEIYGKKCPATVNVSGTVFNDINGLTDNDVNGVGIGSPSNTPIYASLVNTGGNVVASTVITGNGTYQFTDVEANSSYSMVLSTTQGTAGNAAPTADLPSGWVNTGESPNNATSDGTVDGMQSFSVGIVDVPNIDFGIQQPPTPGIDSIPEQVNPGDSVCVVVPGSKFSGVDASAGGIITSLTICTFPSNIDRIEINGVAYTSGNWPVSGVTIPTNAQGEPTQGICIDPQDGLVTNEINYTVTDNAGATSVCDGKVIIKFYPINLSGIVFQDESGPANVDGSPIGSASGNQLYAHLIDGSGNVEAIKPISNLGMYEFLDLRPNTSYSVVLSDIQGNVNSPAPAAHLPEGWVNVAEDCCDGIGNDGTPDGINLSPTVTSDVPNVNFGIREPVALGNLVWVDSNKNGVVDGNEGPLANAVVNLYEDNNNDGNADGAAIATMTTQSDGLYKFVDLYSGKYIVGVTPPSITGGTLESSSVGEETNPNLDVDNNDNGITKIGDEVRSGTINLISNTEPQGELPNNTAPVPDSNSNLTVDFGFFACPTNFVFDSVDLCVNSTFDLTSVEPALFTGGSWRQNNVLVPTPTAVGSGTYTYTYNEGNCSASGSITLSDNIPDYTPTIQIAPSAITGTSNVRVILTLSEILNKKACSDLYILVPKLLPRFQFTFDNTATSIAGVPVENGNWEFANSNPNFYVWRYTANGGLFPSGGTSTIGYIGTYDPNNTDGQSTFSVQVFQGSGGETNQLNNTDSELLIYFR